MPVISFLLLAPEARKTDPFPAPSNSLFVDCNTPLMTSKLPCDSTKVHNANILPNTLTNSKLPCAVLQAAPHTSTTTVPDDLAFSPDCKPPDPVNYTVPSTDNSLTDIITSLQQVIDDAIHIEWLLHNQKEIFQNNKL